MPQFRRRTQARPTVEAIQLPSAVCYLPGDGGKDDWMVVDEEGYQCFLSDFQFKQKFQQI